VAPLTEGLRIHLVAPVFEKYDAIGNDIAGMRRELSSAGYEVDVFAETWNPLHDSYTRLLDVSEPIWQDPLAVVIYHQSMGWPKGEQLLFSTKNRVVIRYHNVTPPEFFSGYSEPHAEACRAGRMSTAQLARLGTATYWCASTFNAQELVELGVSWDSCRVLAPLHRVPELRRQAPDLSFYEQLEHRTVLLFTGGLKPNKGHRTLIEAFAVYHHGRNPRSTLLLPGSAPPALGSYVEELRALAVSKGVADSVMFTGAVSEELLRFCYQRADIFVCASEHEGFCVPLAEAMAFGLPIVALARTAIPETVGPAGLVFDDCQPEVFAEAFDHLVKHPEVSAALGRQGRERYRRSFAPPVLSRLLLNLVNELRAPASA